MKVLVANLGSTSFKYRLFDLGDPAEPLLARGAIERIGQLISASYDLDEMLDVVYQTLSEITQSSVFFLLICEPGTHAVTNAVFVEQGERIELSWAGQPPTPGS